MCKAERLPRHIAGQSEIANTVETMIDLLTRQIAVLDHQIAGFIAEDQAVTQQARLLTAAPGISPTVPATPLGKLPELDSLCRRKIASLTSIAPHA